jgi:hypothetical protein
MLSIIGVHFSKFIAPYPVCVDRTALRQPVKGDPAAGMFPAYPGFAKMVVNRRSQNIPLRATG